MKSRPSKSRGRVDDVVPKSGDRRGAEGRRRREAQGMDRRAFLVGALAAGVVPPLGARAARAQATPQSGVAASVRLLAFDTFGTVVDWRSSVAAEGEQLGRAKGFTVDWAAFADAWRGGYGPSMTASAAARCRGPSSTYCIA